MKQTKKESKKDSTVYTEESFMTIMALDKLIASGRSDTKIIKKRTGLFSFGKETYYVISETNLAALIHSSLWAHDLVKGLKNKT